MMNVWKSLRDIVLIISILLLLLSFIGCVSENSKSPTPIDKNLLVKKCASRFTNVWGHVTDKEAYFKCYEMLDEETKEALNEKGPLHVP